MQLSLSGRLWETQNGYRITLPQQIEQAAKIGYKGIEIRYPMLPKTAEEISNIKTLLAQNNIAAVFAFCYEMPTAPDLTADAERVIHIVSKLGGSFIRIVLLKEEELPSLKKLSNMAADFSLKVALHFHSGTLCDTLENALRILDCINDKNIYLLFDPIHLALSDEKNIHQAIKYLAPKIGLVNIENFKRASDVSSSGTNIKHKWIPTSPDDPEGLDIKETVSLLKKNGYDGWLNIMCKTPENEDPTYVAEQYLKILSPII